jgi:hypothetical protein
MGPHLARRGLSDHSDSTTALYARPGHAERRSTSARWGLPRDVNAGMIHAISADTRAQQFCAIRSYLALATAAKRGKHFFSFHVCHRCE